MEIGLWLCSWFHEFGFTLFTLFADRLNLCLILTLLLLTVLDCSLNSNKPHLQLQPHLLPNTLKKFSKTCLLYYYLLFRTRVFCNTAPGKTIPKMSVLSLIVYLIMRSFKQFFFFFFYLSTSFGFSSRRDLRQSFSSLLGYGYSRISIWSQ